MHGRCAIAGLAWALAAAGCRTWPSLQTAGAVSVAPPAVARARDVHGVSQAADGTLLELHYKDGQRLNLLLGGTSAEFSPSDSGSGIELTEGYAYVNGTFTSTTATSRSYWPIVATKFIGIGADGTEFIVQANLGASLQRVFFLSGTSVHVWPLTAPAGITTLTSVGYVDIAISDGVVTSVSALQPIPGAVVTPGDMSDPKWFSDMVKAKAGDFDADIAPIGTVR